MGSWWRSNMRRCRAWRLRSERGWCKIVAWHHGSLDGDGLYLYSRNLYQVLELNDLYFAIISCGQRELLYPCSPRIPTGQVHISFHDTQADVTRILDTNSTSKQLHCRKTPETKQDEHPLRHRQFQISYTNKIKSLLAPCLFSTSHYIQADSPSLHNTRARPSTHISRIQSSLTHSAISEPLTPALHPPSSMLTHTT
jgi:hypothetical protein